MLTPNSYISVNERPLAEKIVERQYQLQPEIWKPYGHPGREKSIRDAGYHLTFLGVAVNAADPNLFIEYLSWTRELFTSLKFPDSVLPSTLDCTKHILTTSLPEKELSEVMSVLEKGILSLDQPLVMTKSYVEGDTPLDDLTRSFIHALLHGERREASEMILDAVEKGVNVRDIYLSVFQRSQREIGRLWQTNMISVAQEHYCTAATQLIMSQLYPRIFSGERKDRRIVTSCVGGELHEIGARMVADFFEMEGWDTYFLGANTPPQSVIRTVEERNAQVLALSATMTFHVEKISEIINLLRNNEKTADTLVMVGGYPFNLSEKLWQQVGADGYAPDAKAAIIEAEKLL